MASVNTNADIISTVLNRLEPFKSDCYFVAFGPEGKHFFATPNGYAANYLPSKTLAELAGCDIKRVLWASFGDYPESWFFSYQFKSDHVAIRLGPQAPRTLFEYIEQISGSSKELLGLLRVQLGKKGSFVAWSKTSWACHNVPEMLRARLCKWSSGTRTQHGMTMGQLSEGALTDVAWHEDGSYFVRTQNNHVSWKFRLDVTHAAWTKLWTEVGLTGPGVAEVAGLAHVAINPHSEQSDTFAFIKKQGAGAEAPFVLHFGAEPVHARLSPTDQRLQAVVPKPEVPFAWAASIKSGRPHAREEGWELELKKGQRVRVVQEMGNNWFVVVGKKSVKGWVHGSWLDFSDGRSHEPPKAAWYRFLADNIEMMKSAPIKKFPAMADYVDVCTRAGCMPVKGDGSSLGICAHDLQALLRGSGCYSVEWLKKERTIWHPDKFGRFCAPELAEQLKLRAQQLFVLAPATVNATRHFSGTASSMTATKIDGTAIAKSIRERLGAKIKERQSANPRYKPSLKIVQVGDRSDSSTYVRMKLKAAEEANIDCELVQLPDDTSEADLLHLVYEYNNNPSVHGILVQLPLPKHISEHTITSAVADEKDVDGFGVQSIGELAKRGGKPLFVPCTPKGVMVLLQEAGVDISGKNAVVLGRSDIVGSPVSHLLKNADATVTVCHSRTADLPNIVRRADIVVAAIGKAQFVQGDWLKPGAVVIDVGTNFVPDDTKKSGQRLVGDVDYSSAAEVASQITPVPGGVGPMTIAMLLQNLVDSADATFDREKKRKITPLPLKIEDPIPSDHVISRKQHPKQITTVAKEVGILPHELEPYGATKAKVDLSLLKRLEHRRNGRYILVAGITPTPLGEGKSTTTIGVAQALGAQLGKICFANVRQPSMGPTFGIKGGAAGGGYSQVIPMDQFNLHLTGDIHAITAANNLLAAAIDTRMFHESTQKDGPLYKRLVPTKKGKREFVPVMFRRLKKLGIDKTDPNDLTEDEIRRFARLDIDPETITWRRVLDVNDRHLRQITIGQAPTEKGHTRETGFDISVASECMAILALSNDLGDMRERLGRMVVASSRAGDPVTCDDIGAGGALTALLVDAIKPNMMQTLEGTPVFVHAGPFANISIGASSVLADKLALKLAGTEPDENHDEQTGYVVTESGFDFTMGGERFFNIKCRSSGLVPDTVVIVATVRALKVHGGGPDISPGAQLQEVYRTENVELLRKGCVNLKKHIENAKQYGVPVVVAINKFATDTQAEIDVIREEAIAAGAEDAIPANHFAEGGKGAIDLAKGIISASAKPKPDFKLLYDVNTGSVQERMEIIAKQMYGADKVEFSELAQKKVDTYVKQGLGNLPICVAKTQYSLSHDPALKGAPTGFTVPIRDVRMAAGAGYLYALAADIQTIPGLPTAPGYLNIDVDVETAEIDGMF
ncbi:FTHFS-domain-containing protein [Ophiobolus disseminans]|uniref:C-1-tetrahydrofolate synthase, cytoplasmic n=1 Tax=Ophiobolus disseminans TaxID=1469910 RepID=A0A6A7AI54_9PLEO|nr:FTHFS-domain-containing protein [Ophiobolus disseminans]